MRNYCRGVKREMYTAQGDFCTICHRGLNFFEKIIKILEYFFNMVIYGFLLMLMYLRSRQCGVRGISDRMIAVCTL